MSSPQGRKPKPENYEYSWFFPADGRNGPAAVTQVPLSELEGTVPTENPEIAAMEARTEKWRHSGQRKAPSKHARSLSLGTSAVSKIGILGWSCVAGSGAVVLAMRAGQFPGTQLGILAGVWLGVSAAIWFIPGVLSRGEAVKA